MKILITGGGGFIAAWIIKKLITRGDTVRVLDARVDRAIVRSIAGPAADTLDWRVGDVSNGDAVHDAAMGCDHIFHMAAVLTPACAADPIRGCQINLIGTLNVFEAARRQGLKTVLYMSSAGVFGPDDGVTPRPTTHYGAFKLACEGSARAYWIEHGIASVGFRPLVVYGPGRETGLTAGPTLACRAAAEGRAFTIPFSGASDFLFVGDIAQAFVAASARRIEAAAAYNLTGIKADTADFADEINRRVQGARIAVDGPLLPVAAAMEAGSIRQVFPEIPLTSLADGISATVAHYGKSA